MIVGLASKYGKTTCPYCNKKRHWQVYVVYDTGELLPKHFGRCDNEVKCGKWVKPTKQDLIDLGIISHGPAQEKRAKKQQKTAKTKPNMEKIEKPKKSYFNPEIYQGCENPQNYDKNQFLQGIPTSKNGIPKELVYNTAKMYRLGTIVKGEYVGACVFPFIDAQGNIHACQTKLFDKYNHTKTTTFLHKILEKHYKDTNKPIPQWLQDHLKSPSYIDCLFGEHLLQKNDNRIICIVEAPKTAVYCSLYFGNQKTLWLSCYSKSALNVERMRILAGKTIVLFPDLSKDGNTFAEWKGKAYEIQRSLPSTKVLVCDILEKFATSQAKEKGLDIADFIITQSWANLQNKQTESNENAPTHTNIQEQKNVEKNSVKIENKALQTIEQKRKRLDMGIEHFLNELPQVIATEDEEGCYLVKIADFYKKYTVFCKEYEYTPADIDSFLHEIKKIGYEKGIVGDSIRLIELPF